MVISLPIFAKEVTNISTQSRDSSTFILNSLVAVAVKLSRTSSCCPSVTPLTNHRCLVRNRQLQRPRGAKKKSFKIQSFNIVDKK